MPNRLADSLSPYLEQHALNPVDWYPWCDEALTAARTSDRPILLSIGYSACHWCHVMAHESFDDESIAERMNAWFVNVKVDREERPDLDRIYQLGYQLLTGRGGGWPLTMFLEPSDLTPFAAGTYFPPEGRDGLVGFGDLLERVHAAWLNQRDAIGAQNRQLAEALSVISARRTEASTGVRDAGHELLGQLEGRQDRRHGGFGDAPKFPQAPLLAWLLRTAEDDEGAAGMLGDALDAMSNNGLFDHVGGGFFRYCVDAAWEIPHFEKMLSDNALLLPLYAEASVRWGRDGWAETARRTADFLAEEMQLADGGFASSFDADSLPPEPEPGVAPAPAEGAYYLWTPAQLDACLDAGEADLARARFGLDGPANFESDRWHLVIARSVEELVDRSDDADSMRARLAQVRKRLSACRRRRPLPLRDDKMLAGWNALAAVALMRSGGLLDEPAWVELGSVTLDRIWTRLFEHDPPRAVWRDGRSAQSALLDDYGAVLTAILERLSASWESGWLDRAVSVADAIAERFFDADRRVVYLTPAGHERLPIRPTANLDEAVPSGASLAARALLRLGHLTASADRLDLADRIIEAARGDIERMPAGHPSLLLAARERERPGIQVLIGGSTSTAGDWHARLRRDPDLHVYRIDNDGDSLPDVLARTAASERATAVVCIGDRCLAPALEESELDERLNQARSETETAG